ncbi:uncharacterized protein BT62DRAFT_919936 [Guyanagaster necrorhizus]|uniref:Uncharacterized protein n=1 Tax=Guyanagaster necrorhizus TaxID=856835 RepID=A0A9P8ASU4_9AGAR|nr:uncharacterized protein BT62DRAFT_919936 [Guyanagaster necrorhizus MCA 3950]KAG7446704.1 hypothetical protein BT62DRAFT_919936 [Guyanagaster necrorhizus MCA 3950]
MPGTLSMPLRWLSSQIPELLEASLTASILPPGPALEWGGFSQMTSSDDKYRKKLSIGTSQPETSSSHLTTTMLFNRRSEGSRMSCSQYVMSLRGKPQFMSSRGRKLCSMMSTIETSSKKSKGSNWKQPTLETGIEYGLRSQAFSLPYELTLSPLPPSFENLAPQAVEYWNTGLMAPEPDETQDPQPSSTLFHYEPPAQTPSSGVMSLFLSTTDYGFPEMLTFLLALSEVFSKVGLSGSLSMMTTSTIVEVTRATGGNWYNSSIGSCPATTYENPLVVGLKVRESIYDQPAGSLLEKDDEDEEEETESSNPPRGPPYDSQEKTDEEEVNRLA